MQEIPKPQELLAARRSAEELFALLRAWFEVSDHVRIDLRAIDSAVGELSDPQVVMAMAMRKLQALHLLTTPGVRTTTDVVLTVVQDLERALQQAPGLHLRHEAATTDWDAALAELDTDDTAEQTPVAGAAGSKGAATDDITRFRKHHAVVHEAARAVLRASDGEIRVLR